MGQQGYPLRWEGWGDPPKRGGPKVRKGFILFDIYIPPHVSLHTYTPFFLIHVYIYRLAIGKEYGYD